MESIIQRLDTLAFAVGKLGSHPSERSKLLCFNCEKSGHRVGDCTTKIVANYEAFKKRFEDGDKKGFVVLPDDKFVGAAEQVGHKRIRIDDLLNDAGDMNVDDVPVRRIFKPVERVKRKVAATKVKTKKKVKVPNSGAALDYLSSPCSLTWGEYLRTRSKKEVSAFLRTLRSELCRGRGSKRCLSLVRRSCLILMSRMPLVDVLGEVDGAPGFVALSERMDIMGKNLFDFDELTATVLLADIILDPFSSKVLKPDDLPEGEFEDEVELPLLKATFGDDFSVKVLEKVDGVTILDTVQTSMLVELICEFQDIFPESIMEMKRMKGVEFEINLIPGKLPEPKQARRFTIPEMDAMNELIEFLDHLADKIHSLRMLLKMGVKWV